jgi:hypothetical protein
MLSSSLLASSLLALLLIEILDWMVSTHFCWSGLGAFNQYTYPNVFWWCGVVTFSLLKHKIFEVASWIWSCALSWPMRWPAGFLPLLWKETLDGAAWACPTKLVRELSIRLLIQRFSQECHIHSVKLPDFLRGDVRWICFPFKRTTLHAKQWHWGLRTLPEPEDNSQLPTCVSTETRYTSQRNNRWASQFKSWGSSHKTPRKWCRMEQIWVYAHVPIVYFPFWDIATRW